MWAKVAAWLSKAWRWICLALVVLLSVLIPLYGYERRRRMRAEVAADASRRIATLEAAAAAEHRATAVRLRAERQRNADRLRDIRKRAEEVEAEISAAHGSDLSKLWAETYGGKRED